MCDKQHKVSLPLSQQIDFCIIDVQSCTTCCNVDLRSSRRGVPATKLTIISHVHHVCCNHTMSWYPVHMSKHTHCHMICRAGDLWTHKYDEGDTNVRRETSRSRYMSNHSGCVHMYIIEAFIGLWDCNIKSKSTLQRQHTQAPVRFNPTAQHN